MSDKKLFSQNDYIKYCKHENTLVKVWAYEHLTKLYPEDETTRNYTYQFLNELSENPTLSYNVDSRIRYKIYSYLEDNYQLIPDHEIYDFLKNYDEIANLDKIFLLNILAQKQYKVDEILDITVDIMMNQDLDANSYLKLEKILTNLQIEDAYKYLKNINPELKSDMTFIESYMISLLKYRKIADIDEIINKTMNNLDNINYRNIFYELSELYYGEDYLRALNNSLIGTNTFNEILDNLNRHWPENRGIKRLNSLIDKTIKTNFSSHNYKAVFNKLVDLIISKLKNKSEGIDWNVKNLDSKFVNSQKDNLIEEDYWIVLILSKILKHKEMIFRKDDDNFFIFLLISMLIVTLEDINFKQAVKKAKNDPEYLWEIFTYDRSELPAEITEMVIEKGDKFEDKAISYISRNKYASPNHRIITYLEKINSLKAVPHVVNLVDESQGDFICEKVTEFLQKIDRLTPEMLEKAYKSGDEITILFTSGALEWLTYDRSARILINYWEKDEFNFKESFINSLKHIGSKIGYDYLKNMGFGGQPDYFYEALIILGTINNASQAEIDNYKNLLKENKDPGNNRLFSNLRQSVNKNNNQELLKNDKYEKKENGTIINKQKDVGRNDPCPCGSGKKYKKCCGR